MARTAHPIRGLLMVDQRLVTENLDAAESTYTQAGPKAGGVVPPTSSTQPGVLKVSGDQDDTLVLEVLQGGNPGLAGGARVGYRFSSEAAGLLRGHLAPVMVTRFSAGEFDSTARSRITAIPLADGKLLVAWEEAFPAPVCKMRTFDASTNTWSASTDGPEGATGFCRGVPALLRLKTGHILCLFYNATSNGYWEAWRTVSPDSIADGWTEYSTAPFGGAGPTASSGIRTKLLYLSSTADIAFFQFEWNAVRQYASSSQGTRLALVDDWTAGISSGSAALASGDACVLPSGKLGVVTISSVNGRPQWSRIASAFEVAADADRVDISTTDTGDVWCWADESGLVYVLTRDDGGNRMRLHYSDDDGDTWTEHDHGVFMTPSTDAGNFITAGVVAPSLGTAWLVTDFIDPDSTVDSGAVIAIGLGGWSSWAPGETIPSDGEEHRIGWGPGDAAVAGMALPIGVPASLAGWGLAGAGGTWSLAEGGIKLVTAGTDDQVAEETWATATAWGAVLFEFHGGGAAAADKNGVQILQTDGVNGETIGVYLVDDEIYVIDESGAGAEIGAYTFVDEVFPLQVLVVWALGENPAVYIREPQETAWTTVTITAGATSAASGTGGVRFGCFSASAGSSSVYTLVGYHFSASASAGVGAPLPGPVGRALSSVPTPLGDVAASGKRVTYVAGADGPFRLGDGGTLAPAYAYPIEALDWSRALSPRVKHRSTAATEMLVAWNPSEGEDTGLGGRALGLAVLGCNYRLAYLEGSDDGGSTWDTLASLDLLIGSGLTFTRTGDVVRINGGAAVGRYIWRGELVGATVDLGGGIIRKIVAHTEGLWSTTSGKHVELRIALQGSEPASGSAMAIWAHSGWVVAHAVSALYDRYRLRVPAQTTRDGFFETGKVLAGHLAVFGLAPNWGRSAKKDPNHTEHEELPGVVRPRALGPGVTAWTLDWTQGVDLSELRDRTPRYIAEDGVVTEGLANWNDVPWLLWGLVDELRSGEVPVLGLWSIPETSGTTITDPTLFAYGQLASGVNIEGVQGTEGEDEVERVQSVTIRGIP